MRICTYRANGAAHVGLELDGTVYDVEAAGRGLGVALPSFTTLADLVDCAHLEPLRELETKARTARPGDAEWVQALEAVSIESLYRPRKNIVRAHGNSSSYEEHRQLLRGGKPWLLYYAKAPSAVNGTGQQIRWPGRLTTQVYAEPQLAVVVGRTLRYADPSEALSSVFGYAACTDVSSADLKRKHEQWAYGVSLDTFFTWGPFVVTADEVGDPDQLDLSLAVNGETVIFGNTRDALLSTAEVLAELSCGITLDPGDVILTGVPHAPGLGSVPERWLADGDVIDTRVERVGELSNAVVVE